MLLTFVTTAILTALGTLQESRRPVLEAVEDLRIGSLADESQSLSRVSGVVMTRDGRVWIGQPEEGSILVFDSLGNSVSRHGRRGGGPGEYRTLSSLHGLGDSVVVADRGSGRSTLYIGQALAETWPPVDPVDPSSIPAPATGLLSDGRVIVAEQRLARDAQRRLALTVSHPLDRRSAKVVARLDLEASNIVAQDAASGLRMYFEPPIHDGDLFVTFPDRLVIMRREIPGSDTGRVTLIVVSASGDTIRTTSVTGRSRPVPPEFYADEVDRLAQRAAHGRPFPVEVLRRMSSDAMPRPARQPLFDRMVAGADGSLWLRESAAGEATARWLVYDMDARSVRAEVRLPAGAEIGWADRRTILTTEAGEFDEPYVVRYRLRG